MYSSGGPAELNCSYIVVMNGCSVLGVGSLREGLLVSVFSRSCLFICGAGVGYPRISGGSLLVEAALWNALVVVNVF